MFHIILFRYVLAWNADVTWGSYYMLVTTSVENINYISLHGEE